MEVNPNPYTGQEVVITTIDGMRIEAEVLNDSNIDYMVIVANNLAIKGEFKLERKEIYRIEAKKPPDVGAGVNVATS